MPLEGDVTTPFGAVKKKTGLVILVAAGGILLYSYSRAKKQSAAATAATAGANTGIDPATGYAYGSAEDAAALTAQSSYISPAGGGGSGSGTPSGAYPSGSFTSNAQWVQAVIQYGEQQGLLVDSGVGMSAALGRYISGEAVPPDQQALIDQAIAWQGYPPVAGTNGYPPHVNTAPVVTPPTGGSGGGGGTTGPQKSVVKPGWHVDQWIDDINAGKSSTAPGTHTLTYDELVALNPSLPGNIIWRAPAPGYPGTRNNVFKEQWEYVIRA